MNNSLNNILKSEGLPEVRSGQAEITTVSLIDMPAVRQAIASFQGEQGWVCFTDEVRVYRSSLAADELEGKIILSAELVRGNCSLHLRQEDVGWQSWTIEAKPEGDCLVVEESLIGTPSLQGRLNYETYWSQTTEGAAMAPLFSRFAGFDQGGE